MIFPKFSLLDLTISGLGGRHAPGAVAEELQHRGVAGQAQPIHPVHIAQDALATPNSMAAPVYLFNFLGDIRPDIVFRSTL